MLQIHVFAKIDRKFFTICFCFIQINKYFHCLRNRIAKYISELIKAI